MEGGRGVRGEVGNVPGLDELMVLSGGCETDHGQLRPTQVLPGSILPGDAGSPGLKPTSEQIRSTPVPRTTRTWEQSALSAPRTLAQPGTTMLCNMESVPPRQHATEAPMSCHDVGPQTMLASYDALWSRAC